MIRLKSPLSIWMLRLAFVAAAATVIPACGRTNPAPLVVPFSISTSSLPGGNVGVGYNQQLTPVSQTDPVAWTVCSGSLPAGLALDPVTGDITGSPTGSASFSTFTVRAIDASGQVTQRSFQLTVSGGAPAALAITTSSPLPGGDLSTPYDFGFSASGGAPGYTWAVTVGALPTGLTLNPANGGLTGTPGLAGLFNFTIQVTDTAPAVVTKACALTISPALTITSSTLPQGTVGAAYTHPVPALAGTAPLLYSLSSGTMPAGLALNPGAGTVTGTPTAAGGSTVVIRVTDSAGVTQLASLSITINPTPVVVTTTLPASTLGLAYNQTLTPSGGTLPLTWTASAGALPAGLSLSSGGVITGTSTTAGPFSFTALITDAAGGTGSRVLSILINPPVVVTSASLAGWTVNRPLYSQTLTSSGGTGAVTFSITGGTLPAGLTLNAATGLISGTPTAAATSNFTVVATDTLGAADSKALSITINLVPTISTASLPAWTINQAYPASPISVTNGTAAFGYSVTVGTLPAGLTLGAATGIVSGTPTAFATSNFTITVLDAAGASTFHAYSVVINPTPVVSTASVPNWTVNRAYPSQTMALGAGTGTAPITWAVSSGAPPTGLTLNSGGVLSGTPTATGPFTFTVTATDAAGATAPQTFSAFTINPPPTIATALPDWTINRVYSQTLLATAATGTAPYTFAITSGTPPTGLAMSPAGVWSGTPTAPGPFTFAVTITDAAGATGTRTYTSLTINPTPTVSTTSLPDWTISRPYSQTLLTTAATGTTPFTWTISSGTQPTSLSLSSGGVLSGTPSAPGPFTFAVTVTDTAGATATQTYTAEKINPLPTIATTTLPNWTTGRFYTQTLLTTAATGTAPFAWAITAGTQPTSLSLSSGGVLSGTPSVAGTYSFTVTATDAAGATVIQSYNNLVINPPPTIATALPNWTVNRAYTQTLGTTVATGTSPFTWAVTANAPPSGLVLSVGGVLSGTPDTVSQTTFTVTVTDAAGATGSRVYTNLTINATPTVATTSLPDWTDAFAYSQTLLTSVGTGTSPFTWLISSGTQPTGLSLSSSGVLSGTPTPAGTFSFGVTVTDAAGATATMSYNNEVINPPLAIQNGTTLPQWTQGFGGYSQQLTATGGTGGQTWTKLIGTFPTNVTLTSGGLISGNPLNSGDFGFTLQVKDAVGATTSLLFSLHINAALQITPPSAISPWTQLKSGYSYGITSSGGTGATSFSIISGGLPNNLVMNSSGAVSGTPNDPAGPYSFTVQVHDSIGATGTLPMSIQINAPINFTGPNTLAAWTAGQGGYSANTNVTGGTGTLTWSNPTADLPAGLTLTPANGAIIGTVPGVAGNPSFQIRVTDSVGASNQLSFSIPVNPTVSISSTSPLPDAALNTPYSFNFLQAGGTFPFTWSVTSGSPSTGLTLGLGGNLSGTPTVAPGSDDIFSVRVQDAAGSAFTLSNVHMFVVAPLTITTAALPNAPAGNLYTQALGQNGGRSPYTWTLLSGTLPGSITLSSGGSLSGTAPLSDGMSSFVVKVTDTNNRIATKALSITTTGGTTPPLSIDTVSLSAATQGSPYSAGLAGSGGVVGGYQWSILVGALPSGLGIGPSSGIISGTPTATAPSFTVQLTDGTTTVTKSLSITVNPPLNIITSTLPQWTISRGGYPGSLSNSGGTSPFVWSISSGAAPSGLSLGVGGSFAGTPTVSGNSSFTVQVSDAAGATTSTGLSITINPGPQVQNGFIPSSTQGFPFPVFSMQVQSFTGTAPFNWTSSPNPPAAGLTLAGGGSITGSPTTAGSGSVQFTVTDATGATGQVMLTLNVNATPSITNLNLPDGTQNFAYSSQQINVTGGTPGFIFTTTLGAFPAGMSMSASGLVSGTPTASGSFSVTIKATDSVGAFATKGFSFNIVSGPTVNSQSISEGQSGIVTGTNVTLGFTAPMDQSTFSSGASGTVTISPDPSGGAVAAPILFYWTSPTQVTLVFDTKLPVGIYGDDVLAANTPYTLTVTTGVLSTPGAGGLALGAPFVLHFTTQVVNPGPTYTITPDILSPVATGQQTFVLDWSAAMDTTQGDVQIKSNLGFKEELDLSGSNTTGVTSSTWSNGDKKLTIVYSSGLPANGIYQLQVDSFQDATGSFFNSNNSQKIIVTPGQTGTAPAATGIIPNTGSTGVSLDASLLIGFTAPMWPSDLLDPTLVTISGSGAAGVVLDRQLVDFSGIILSPLNSWVPGGTVTVTITAAVRNSAGVAVGADQVFSFTTGSGDSSAMVIDPVFSNMFTGVTDISPFNFEAFFKFTRSGGARAQLNRTTVAPQDVTLVEHAAPNIPIKGYSIDTRRGLELRSDSGWTGLQFSTQYDLTLNTTLQDTQGGSMSAASSGNVLTFTTHASGSTPSTAGRPQFSASGGDSSFSTTSAGTSADLQVQVQSPTQATLTVSVQDTVDTGFLKSLSNGGGGNSQWRYSNGPEISLVTPGDHLLTYTASDTVHTVTSHETLFVFDKSQFPTSAQLVVTTDGGTPTLTWPALTVPGVAGLAVAIKGSGGGYIVLLPTNTTTFTVPADQALPSGTYNYELHFFHFQDGRTDGASSEADTDLSSTPITVP